MNYKMSIKVKYLLFNLVCYFVYSLKSNNINNIKRYFFKNIPCTQTIKASGLMFYKQASKNWAIFMQCNP